MLLIRCPYCAEERPEVEFAYRGEAGLTRPAADCSDAEWGAYLYLRANPRGRHAERWLHRHGCRRFFIAVRDTVTDRFAGTWPAGAAVPGEPGR
jgi:sarcosine oxidase subunit delta